MTTRSKPQQWTDYVDDDDVRRKFLTCGCSENGEHLFQVYEQKPGRTKTQGLFAHCPKCHAQIRLRLGHPR